MRAFPHVDGNFATHVYIPVDVPRRPRAALARRLAALVALAPKGDETDRATHGGVEPLERRNHRRRVLEHEATPTRPPRTRPGDRTERNRETLASCRFRVVEFPCQVEIDLGLESGITNRSGRELVPHDDRRAGERNAQQPLGERAAEWIRTETETGDRAASKPGDQRREKVGRQRPHAGVILDDAARTEHDSVGRQRHPQRCKPPSYDGEFAMGRDRRIG